MTSYKIVAAWIVLGISAVTLFAMLNMNLDERKRQMRSLIASSPQKSLARAEETAAMNAALDDHGVVDTDKRKALVSTYRQKIPEMLVQGRCSSHTPGLFHAMVGNAKTHEAEVDYRVRNGIPLGLVRDHSGARVDRMHTRESWTGDGAKRALNFPSQHAKRAEAYRGTLRQPWP